MESLPIWHKSFRSSTSIKEFLRDISLFSALSEEELDLLVEVSSEKSYAAGDRIIQKDKDEQNASAYIVRSGRVRVVLYKEGAEDVHLTTLNQEEFFGEMSLFYGKLRSATVIAEQDTDVIEIKRDRFLGEIYRKPEIAFKVLGEMIRRLRRSDDGIKELANRIQHGLDDVDAEIRREINPYIKKYAQMDKYQDT